MLEQLKKNWIGEIDGALTFCGVLATHYSDCSKNWKRSATNESYQRQFDTVILPNIKDHDTKIISDYSRQDFEETMEAIEKQGSLTSSTFTPYADSTLQHFRHLIEVVMQVAADKNLCDYILWGTSFKEVGAQKLSTELQFQIAHRKSFGVKEEKDIFNVIATNPMQRGQEMGLLLMFALGLRNGEACGVNYEDFQEVTHNGVTFHVLWVYKSTISGSDTLQSGGKTRNADRVIPVPNKLMNLILTRQTQLELNLGVNIKTYPVACLEQKYDTRCDANRLSSAARRLFRKIGISSHVLYFLELALESNSEFQGMVEREPTAYFFRRNVGTIMHILGLTDAEIQYIIGHDIEDMYETRNEFLTIEKLYAIKVKLDQRLLFVKTESHPCDNVDMALAATRQLLNIVSQKVHIKMPAGRFRARIVGIEPQDTITATLNQSEESITPKLTLTTIIDTDIPSPGRTVSVEKEYRNAYKSPK